MCGRFSLSQPADDIADYFDAQWPDRDDYLPGFNIPPTSITPVLLDDGGGRVIRLMQWGLVPFWAKERGIGNRLINARGETLTEKPSFRHLVDRRRCLVIAHGYFEWQRLGKEKIPHFIHLADAPLMTLAGLWDTWREPGGEVMLHSYTIITTAASPHVAHLHDRMPAIVEPEQREIWLSVNQTMPSPPLHVLKAYQQRLSFYPVSTKVNNVRNDSPDCIERAGGTLDL